MNKAWVLVNTIVGKEHHVLKELRKMPNIKEAHLVTGQYDILILIEATSMKQLNDLLMWNIRRQKDIVYTVTMIVI